MLAGILLSATIAVVPGQSPCAITYVANAGVLFESGTARLLIDTPIREGIPPYATPSAEAGRQIETARAPFDRISAILITHWHEDHFSAEAVAAHLSASPSTVLVTSHEVADRVRKVTPSLPASRFRSSTPDPGGTARVDIAGVAVHVLRIRHSQTRRHPDQHVGFLIQGCQTVLHTGDADQRPDNFPMLRDLPAVDVGLLPYWYLLSEGSRASVQSSLRPARTLAIHIPPAESRDISARLAGVPNTSALIQPGQTVPLSR